MTAAQKPAVERFAEWMLALALRFWPADSKEWGKAMAAELSNVRSSKEVVRWTIGGMQFFLRSVGSRVLEWTQLPVGSNAARGSGLNGGDPPRLPEALADAHSSAAGRCRLLLDATLGPRGNCWCICLLADVFRLSTKSRTA